MVILFSSSLDWCRSLWSKRWWTFSSFVALVGWHFWSWRPFKSWRSMQMVSYGNVEPPKWGNHPISSFHFHRSAWFLVGNQHIFRPTIFSTPLGYLRLHLGAMNWPILIHMKVTSMTIFTFFSLQNQNRQVDQQQQHSSGRPTWIRNSPSQVFGAESKLRKTDVSEHRNCLQLSNSKNVQSVVQGCSSCPSTWM